MRGKVTKRSVDDLRQEALKCGKTLLLWDTELKRFGALCTKSGGCSYFIEYRLGGLRVKKLQEALRHREIDASQSLRLSSRALGTGSSSGRISL